MNIGELRIDNPWWLLLLLVLPLVAWARRRWLGGRPALMFSSVQLVRGIMGLAKPKSGVLLGFLRWTALMLLVLAMSRSEEHTSELQSLVNLVCRLLRVKKKERT